MKVRRFALPEELAIADRCNAGILKQRLCYDYAVRTCSPFFFIANIPALVNRLTVIILGACNMKLEKFP